MTSETLCPAHDAVVSQLIDRMDRLKDDIDELKEMIRQNTEHIQAALIEKERIVAESKADREKLRRDMDAAFAIINELRKTVKTLEEANLRSGAQADLAIKIASALPVVTTAALWLLSKLFHVSL